MVGYLNLEVKTGNMKLIKTSEDGQVAGISFTITGEGYSATKTTNEAGEIDISDLERVRGYDVMKIMRIGRDFISGKSEEPYTPDSSDAQSETTPEPSTRRRETSESEG